MQSGPCRLAGQVRSQALPPDWPVWHSKRVRHLYFLRRTYLPGQKLLDQLLPESLLMVSKRTWEKKVGLSRQVLRCLGSSPSGVSVSDCQDLRYLSGSGLSGVMSQDSGRGRADSTSCLGVSWGLGGLLDYTSSLQPGLQDCKVALSPVESLWSCQVAPRAESPQAAAA